MLSKILDEDSQIKINKTLGSVLFPLKCYCILILLTLLLISYYLYKLNLK